MTGAVILFALVVLLLCISIAMMFYFVFRINSIFDHLQSIEESNEVFAKQMVHNLEYHADEIANLQLYRSAELRDEVVKEVVESHEDEFYRVIEEALILLENKDSVWFNKHFPNGKPSHDTIKYIIEKYNGQKVLDTAEMMEE